MASFTLLGRAAHTAALYSVLCVASEEWCTPVRSLYSPSALAKKAEHVSSGLMPKATVLCTVGHFVLTASPSEVINCVLSVVWFGEVLQAALVSISAKSKGLV